MNHVWTSIYAAPHVARGTTRTPLLRLFNGYAKKCNSTSGSSASPHCLTASIDRLQQCRWRTGQKGINVVNNSRQPFSIGAACLARRKAQVSKPRTDQTILSASGNDRSPTIEAAPRIAAHTEGQSAEAAEGALTWRDYDPIGGMPLPGGELSQLKIDGVFQGTDVHADTGNYILSVMHWRRMSGALIDAGLEFPKDSSVSRTQALRGLDYIRSILPDVDEQLAGQRWVEEESQRMEAEIQERAINLGIYKRNPEDYEDTMEDSDQGTEYGRQKTGQSVLEERRRYLDAKHERQMKEKAAAEARAAEATVTAHRGPLELGGGVQPATSLTTAGATGIGISNPQTKAWLQPVERKPWVKYYEERAILIQKNAIPQLSLLRRLGPSLLMLGAIVAFGVFVSNNYTPAPKSARIWPDTPPAIATLAGITGTMVAFFILSRVPPLWRTMSKYFTILPAYPRSISILGAAFRHDTLSHLVSNTVSLWIFGLLLHEEVGRGTFLALFFASGAVGGYASLVQNVLSGRWNTYIFGSSGCVFGVVGAICTLRPNATFSVAGYEVPVATWFLGVLYGVSQVASIVMKRNPNIDHVGHLAGLLSGVAGALYVRARSRSAQQGSAIKRPEGDMAIATDSQGAAPALT